MNYQNHYAAGLCLLPTYLICAITLSRVGLFLWFVGMALLMLINSRMYQSIVLDGLINIPQWKKYWFLFFGQLAVWWCVIYIVKQST